MKDINVKSVLLGITLCAVIVIATAATNNNSEGVVAKRYQLFSNKWWDGNSNTPFFQDEKHKSSYLTGMFKIDSSNGQVWALTTSNPDGNMLEGWVPIK